MPLLSPLSCDASESQGGNRSSGKVENIYYTNLSPAQEEKYEEAKSFYRHKILDLIEKEG